MKDQLLRQIPSVSDLLATPGAQEWLARHPRKLVTDCIRQAVETLRGQILSDTAGRCGPAHVSADFLLERAGEVLTDRTQYHLTGAINATGVIMHTGLGRAVLAESVVDSLVDELKGYVTLAIDRATGQRSDRDRRIEGILTELTGAESATVANNNAAATLLTLSALTAGKEVIVSRGQLIEIGGSFRLPDIMAISGARLIEVGTTNRTHLRDYAAAITDQTAAILRVHPSNYRIVGFESQPELAELVELAKQRNVLLIDDIGAGALVGLERFGLPHEPTVQESIAAGADVTLFSADKLIGGPQGGIMVGKNSCIERIRKHPLWRASRVDKFCLMALERTLHLFRDPDRLAEVHPLYRMLGESNEALKQRAETLSAAIASASAAVTATAQPSQAYLGSGSLPMQQLPSFVVALRHNAVKADELARRLRLDQAAVFGRIEQNAVLLDVRTIRDEQVTTVAQAVTRAVQAR